jgi:hypothetical protein
VALSKSTIRKFNKLYLTVLSMQEHIQELLAKESIEEAAIKNPKKVVAKRKPGRPRKKA